MINLKWSNNGSTPGELKFTHSTDGHIAINEFISFVPSLSCLMTLTYLIAQTLKWSRNTMLSDNQLFDMT